MNVFKNFRTISFWLADFLKGGSIRKNFKEIKFVLENYHSKKAKNMRNEYLTNILSHAISTTSFYKNVSSASIYDFPVINKSIIRENFDVFISLEYKDIKKAKVSSSGSTGTPFSVYQSKIKRSRNTADALYFAEHSGFTIGQRLYYMRVWTDYNKKSRFLSWMQNVEMHDVTKMDEEALSKLLRSLITVSGSKGILSYASSIEALCKHADAKEVIAQDCKITSVIANAEALTSYAKETFLKVFGTHVVSRYSNAENGIFAQQKPDSSLEFSINSASYYIEILKFDDNEPVSPGETGRIVITDLFNFCMPIIRYDTGDVGSIKLGIDDIPVFKRVDGRRQDLIYNTEGDLISSFVIGGLMKTCSHFKQFQFIQETQYNYALVINTNGELEDEADLIVQFKQVLGEDSLIRIDYVDEIPLLASGKRRQVVNNFKKV